MLEISAFRGLGFRVMESQVDKTMANEVEVGFCPDNCKSNRAAKSQNGNSHTTRSRFTQNSGPEAYTISINPLGDPNIDPHILQS